MSERILIKGTVPLFLLPALCLVLAIACELLGLPSWVSSGSTAVGMPVALAYFVRMQFAAGRSNTQMFGAFVVALGGGLVLLAALIGLLYLNGRK